MARPSRRLTIVCGTLAGMIAAAVPATAQQVYRYVDPDGRIVYSDQAPPPDAKSVEAKRLSPNLIENDPTPLATKRAQDRYPVTLYTFACGDVCDRAEALLNRRGIPFARTNVEEAQGAEKLKKLTGELQAPVLQAGDKLIAKGFNEGQWQALLDEAGYPTSPPLRRPRPPPEVPKSVQAPPMTTVPASGYPKD